MLPGGSGRPPDKEAAGFPGARYSAAKIRKLATSRLATSMASLRDETPAHRVQPAPTQLPSSWLARGDNMRANEPPAPVKHMLSTGEVSSLSNLRVWRS